MCHTFLAFSDLGKSTLRFTDKLMKILVISLDIDLTTAKVFLQVRRKKLVDIRKEIELLFCFILFNTNALFGLSLCFISKDFVSIKDRESLCFLCPSVKFDFSFVKIFFSLKM